MENITRILLLKEIRPHIYDNFLVEISSSKEKLDGYKARCDMELSRLEENPHSAVDFYTMEKFLSFIYDADFGIDFYNEHAEKIIISFDRFLQKQTHPNFKDFFFEHSERLRKFSEKAFEKHLSFYEKLFSGEKIFQNMIKRC